MKLLSKPEAYSANKRQHDFLVEKNVRLFGFIDKGIKRLNQLKPDYSKDKERVYKEFQDFAQGLMLKKSVLLQELNEIEAKIKEKNDLYYALVEKEDELEAKIEEMSLKEKKLDMREGFIAESESHLTAKWNKLLKC